MRFTGKNERRFVVLTCLLSLIQGGLYILDGFRTSWELSNIIMTTLDFLFIPLVLIFRDKGFNIFLPIMSGALIFISIKQPTQFYNNFSGLLCLFIAIMIFSNRCLLMIIYLSATALICGFYEVPLYEYLIHASRSIWIFVVYDFIISRRFDRKPIILTDEEKRLLSQMSEGTQQKNLELDGLSESTIRRRLKQARRRNGVENNDELLELFRKLKTPDV